MIVNLETEAVNISTQAEGAWTYKEACAVIADLKKTGVESGVTVGGIWLTFDLELHGCAVIQIIKQHQGVFCHQTLTQALTIQNAQRVKMEREIAQLERLWNLSE